MVTTKISVNSQAADALNRSLRDFSASMGKAAAYAPRVAAMSICNSLRARTKRAPKLARAKEYKIVRPTGWTMQQVGKRKVPTPAPYVTYRRGQRLPIAIKRYELTRRLGTEKERTHPVYAYAHLRHAKDGSIVSDAAAEKREIRSVHLKIARAGLAKRSWNWIKQAIYKGFKPIVVERNKRARNPGDAVNGSYRATKSGHWSGAIAKIENNLDYIKAALPAGAVDEALTAAERDLDFKRQLKLKKKVEAKDIKGLADMLWREFEVKFNRARADAAGVA